MEESDQISGRVFDIKRFAVHDGPGIRTAVFLKGCPLRCVWCHNPEGISAAPELVYYESNCIHCGACVKACSYNARRVVGDRLVYSREECAACATCIEQCFAGALHLYGRTMTLDEVMVPILQDRSFYEDSRGGVTLSGGEPLAQAAFATALLRKCRAEGLHTALDTCGSIPWPILEAALSCVDLVLYDVKHTDPDKHRDLTGVSNTVILDNLHRLNQRGTPVEIRIPVVPTLNDDPRTLTQMCRLLSSMSNITAVRLLPYHRLAGSKYQRLDRENTLPEVPTPTRDHLRSIAAFFSENGLSCPIEVAD